jgi:hypothetical protein
VANADFEGGGDGRGRGVRHFFGQIGPTQPLLIHQASGDLRCVVTTFPTNLKPVLVKATAVTHLGPWAMINRG